MTKTQWQAKVTEIVDSLAGPNFGWDDVSEGEWETLWLKRLSPQDAAKAFFCEKPPVTGDSITN